MSTATIVRSILEGLAIIAVFVGLLYEDRLIRWENKIIRKLRKSTKKRKNQHAKCAVHEQQFQPQISADWMHKPNRPARANACRFYLFKKHAA